MIDRFTELLDELGKIINLKFQPEEGDIVTILVDKKLPIQIKFVTDKDSILICSGVTEVLPGKFRENVLKKALQTNALPNQKSILSYQEERALLVLFSLLPQSLLDGAKFHEQLLLFTKKAFLWKEAIETNNLSLLDEHKEKESPFSFKS